MDLHQAEEFRLKKRAEGAKSDGCTFAPEIGTPCCEMHDFLRRFLPDGITPLQADNLLFRCIIKKGKGIKAPLYWLAAPIYWSVSRVCNLLGIYR